MGSDRGRLALEAADRDLERSSGCHTGREVHQLADRTRTDLARGGISGTSPWKSTGERRAGQGPLPRRLQSSPGVCPALPPGRSLGTRNPEPHRMAAAQCAWLSFGKRAQTGPERTLVRARRRTRVSGEELSFGISAFLSSCLVPVLEGAEQLFLFVPIDHPGYQSYLSLEHTIRTFERGRKEQHLFLNVGRQLSELHDLAQPRPAHMSYLRQFPIVSNCSLID